MLVEESTYVFHKVYSYCLYIQNNIIISARFKNELIVLAVLAYIRVHTYIHTVKSVLNGSFNKRNFVLNRNVFRSRHYQSVPWLNGNLASAKKCSGPLRYRLRQVLLYMQRPCRSSAVRRWLPTAAARVRVRAACGVCGGQRATGTGFLPVLRFPLPIIPPISPLS
jgi:hypothetical protein